MFWQFLSFLRAKPVAVRSSIALGIASGATLLIAVMWLGSWGTGLSRGGTVAPTLSPLDAISKPFAKIKGEFGDEFAAGRETYGALKTATTSDQVAAALAGLGLEISPEEVAAMAAAMGTTSESILVSMEAAASEFAVTSPGGPLQDGGDDPSPTIGVVLPSSDDVASPAPSLHNQPTL
jgi:hypothetical protein